MAGVSDSSSATLQLRGSILILCEPCRPPEYNDIIEFMGAMASITPLITPVRLSNTTATSNATGFLTPSQWAWYQPVVGSAFAKVNDFLIENKGSFRESVYGAFAFFDPVWNGGPVDELVYMVFYNSTAKHSPAVFMNVRTCCHCVCVLPLGFLIILWLAVDELRDRMVAQWQQHYHSQPPVAQHFQRAAYHDRPHLILHCYWCRHRFRLHFRFLRFVSCAGKGD